MVGQIDLETLHHIIEQTNKDVPSYCSRIISKLLHSLDKISKPNLYKTLKAIKALLNLYEEFCVKDGNVESALPIVKILEKIKEMVGLSCNNDMQAQLSSVLCSWFRISFVENPSEALLWLIRFYDCNMSHIHTAPVMKEQWSECLMFSLKMMSAMHDLLRNVPQKEELIQCYLQQKPHDRDDGQVFADLILHCDNDVAMETLTVVVPAYVEVFRSDGVLGVVWKAACHPPTASSRGLSRTASILCGFFGALFEKGKTNSNLAFFEEPDYWRLLQSVLVDEDPATRKQGRYLLRRTVEVLRDINKTVVCSLENEKLFYWDPLSKDKLCKTYGSVVTVLEFLEESQVHIVKPILKVAEDLLEDLVGECQVSPSWVALVHRRALIHESVQVLKWGLAQLLKLPRSFFAREDVTTETVAFLVPVLNQPSIYYGDGWAETSGRLEGFLGRMAEEDGIGKLFFGSFIETVCSLVWSPESLFFVSRALSSLPRRSLWTVDVVSRIRIFAKRTFATYHKLIGVAIQCNLLTAVSTLVDEKSVSLRDFILLVSSFPLLDSVERSGSTFLEIIGAIKACYSEEEASRVLDFWAHEEASGEAFDGKSVALGRILLFYSFEGREVSALVANRLSETLLSFKDADKRLYHDESAFDGRLSVISRIFAADAKGPGSGMLEPALPLVGHVMSYIRNRLERISELRELGTFQLCLNAFENVASVLRMLRSGSEEVKSFFEEVLDDIAELLRSGSGYSSVGLYCRFKFLSLLHSMNHPNELKSNFLVSFLISSVNRGLEKDESCRVTTKDAQSLWGRINSEFVEAKWKLLEGSIVGRSAVALTSDDVLVELCLEGLETGGLGALHPIMSVLKEFLPGVEDSLRVGRIAGTVWRFVTERRKTEEFKWLVKAFVEMVFQEALVIRGGEMEQILMENADSIFADSSLAAVTALVRHFQRMELTRSWVPLFCHVAGKALTFGPVERKDERLTTSVCALIEKSKICPVWETRALMDADKDQKKGAESRKPEMGSGDGDSEQARYSWPTKSSDHFTSGEIRARAVEKISRLEKHSSTDRAAAKELIRSLFRLSEEASQSRGRHFGNSHVHRVKLRVAQALLLLEPLLSDEKDERTEFSDRLCDSLLSENLQPSVRGLQEWLLVRVLAEDEGLCDGFFDRLDISKTIRKTGLCSLMAVGLHVCLLRGPQSAEALVDKFVEMVLPYLFHQHFEVRLHAQVIIRKLSEIAETKKLEKVKGRWGNVFSFAGRVCSHMRDQHLTNFLKLEGDFFFACFDALKHYSLQVIYTDFPRLTGVDCDEWISGGMFRFCGVDPSVETKIPLRNAHSSLSNAVAWERREVPDVESEFNLKEKLEAQENYQRKVTAGCRSNPSSESLAGREEGLVVVASLVDRIPNLGGLARTCEIFGASEYVLGSLKHAEDKQFTSLSVTAEKWIRIKEVKPQNLKSYLLAMKQNGYEVVGAEQTMRSRSLSSMKFLRKTLLLLGNEKEGIPPDLLPFVDVCVEIPQMGIIRSLNVHVTGALFIWEYAKQNNFS